MAEVTAEYNAAHWAFEAFGVAYDKWRAALPDDSAASDFDIYSSESLDAFFAAHPDGWPLHPDDPTVCKTEI